MNIFALLDLVKRGALDERSKVDTVHIEKEILSHLHAKHDSYRLNQIDNQGNTILHRLFEMERPPLKAVQFILLNAHDLINQRNFKGKLPCDILWENEGRIYSNRPLKALIYPFMETSMAKNMIDQQINICLGRRKAANEFDEFDEDYHFDYIQESEFSTLLKRPSLICFSGRGAFMPKTANGFAKLIQTSLNLHATETPQMQILSAWYPGNNQDIGMDVYSFHSPFMKNDEDSPIHYVERFTKRYLTPLYTDNEGMPLPVQQAAKNLRQVNLLGYSYGASIIQMLADCMTHQMCKMRYSEAEIIQMQSQVFVFTVGADINPNHYKNHFQTYHLINSEDEAVYPHMYPVLAEKEIDDNFLFTHLLHCSNHHVLCVKSIPNAMETGFHSLKTYLDKEAFDTTHRFISVWENTVIANALNNSVENSKRTELCPLTSDLSVLPEHIEYVPNKSLLLNLRKNADEINYNNLLHKSKVKHKSSHHSPLDIAFQEKIHRM